MVRDFLLILLGIVIGTAAPHLANMANFALGWDWGAVMEEWSLVWRSFVVEIILALIIIFFLRKLDKKREDREDANTQRIIDAIKESGKKLEDKIDGKSENKTG